MGPLKLACVTLAVLFIATGCSATVKGSFRTVSSPIRLSSPAIDAMTDGEVRDVLSHNIKGQKLCGWKA